VTAQEWARRLLVNFRRVTSVSSTGFAALFKLLSRARAEGREVKLCGMENGVRLGAEIIGLQKLVEIHDDEAAALRTFARAWADAGQARGSQAGWRTMRTHAEQPRKALLESLKGK
jgi:hypothetical protein